MLELLSRLEETAFASIARESLYGFQILVAIHIIGIVFSVGTLLWVDLRMIGVCLTRHRLTAVHRSLSKWFTWGFAAMFVTGTMLFAGFATSAYENAFFRTKIAIILLAGANAAAFHVLLRRLPRQSDSGPPAGAIRVAGLLSIAFWLSVILCGRMMSYTLF